MHVASVACFFIYGVGIFMSKDFGEHLRTLRKAKGYAQKDMADMLNINRSTYIYYETGKSQPSFQNLKKLCEILEVDYNTILDY